MSQVPACVIVPCKTCTKLPTGFPEHAGGLLPVLLRTAACRAKGLPPVVCVTHAPAAA